MKLGSSTFKIFLIVSVAWVFHFLINWPAFASDAGCPQAPQSLQPSNPSFSKSEIKKIKNYIKKVYGIVGVADDVLDAALGETYEGAPLLWWVGLFVNADKVYELLTQGKEREAFYYAYKFVAKVSFVKGLTLIGLRSVAVIASVAALPIEWAIETFVKKVNTIALQNQFVLYMEVRRLGYSHAFVLAGNDILDPHIILFSDPGRWLYLVDNGERVIKIPSYGPARAFGTRREEVYAMACALWDLKLHKDDYTSDKQAVKEALQRAIQGIPTNRPPIANAGPDQTVVPRQTVQLDGSGSYDPDGDKIRYQWAILSRENSARCIFRSSRTIVNPKIMPLREGSCTVELQVIDARGARSAPDQVVITATTDITPPALIQNFQASDNEDSQSTLTWTNPPDSDLSQVIVKRKTTGYPANHDDGETRLTIDSATPGRAESFVDTGLTNGTTYYYAVFSRDNAGNWNDQVIEGQNADTGRPEQPGIGEKIVFASLRDGNWEIYLMNADGTNQINLTNNPAFDGDPAFSPDGGKIVFSSSRGCPAGTSGLFIMNVDGTNVRRLTGATTAPDGSEFCEPVVDRHPSFSPDGSKIVFRSSMAPGGPPTNQEIFLLDLSGTWPSNVVNLTNNPANDTRPTFTPDGNKIVFSSDRDGIFGSGIFDIYIMNIDGSGVIRLTNDPGDDDVPFVSPDGTKIIFTSNRSGNYEVYVMNLDGTNITNLTNNPADDGDSHFSSDGSRITFVSDRDGNFEVYIMNADGSNQVRLTNTPAMELEPRFQPQPLMVASSSTLPRDSASATIQVRPSIVGGARFIKFVVADSMVREFKFSIFDLAGRPVFRTDWVENGFAWNLLNDRGQRLANGVYLYVVTARTRDGRIIRGPVKKLVVLR